MEKLLESSIIKALVLSANTKKGPQPIYTLPEEIDEDNLAKSTEKSGIKLTFRDYSQISIKNLSLFINTKEIKDEKEIQEYQCYGILPYPDFELASLTYFRLIQNKFIDEPIPLALSILVNENEINYLYNNINRIKEIILKLSKILENELFDNDDFKSREKIEPLFKDFLIKLLDIEKIPHTPATSQRKMKILFAGLDDSGKTSFLLAVDRKYSKLIGLKPTRGANIVSIETLGSNIFLWDLGGQLTFREKYLNKSQIYLYDTDLLYYFIDVKNADRFEESIDYLRNLVEKLREFKQKTPIIFVLSKGDPDILDSDVIKENIKTIKSKITEVISEEKSEMYITSIFDNYLFSILKAFSAGLSKLSPNRELLNLNVKDLSVRSGIYLTLLLNKDGLDLADFYSEKCPI